MNLEEFLQDAVRDRLESWELIEFLQISIEDVLSAALENDWIDEENLSEVLEFAGINNG